MIERRADAPASSARHGASGGSGVDSGLGIGPVEASRVGPSASMAKDLSGLLVVRGRGVRPGRDRLRFEECGERARGVLVFPGPADDGERAVAAEYGVAPG